MRVVLQRVKNAQVETEGKIIGKIDQGYLLLVGFTHHDDIKEIDYLAHKIANARLFSDENGKMNLSIKQVHGKILSVSQFTLYATNKNGNRPSFIRAQKPELAQENYDYFNEMLRSYDLEVETGKFGAQMEVSLTNDGPVTIIYDTAEIKK